jgi:ribonuclease BN (tRNA processing enzyme)
VKLTIVGSGTAVPSAERGSPCCYLAVSGEKVVFDLGSGSVRGLWRRGVDVRELDVLALSHFHPDHTADLVPLLFALRNPEFSRRGRLTLVGPKGTRAYLEALEGLYGDWVRPRGYSLEVTEVHRDTVDFTDWRLTAAPTGHTAESVAFRVEEAGGSVVVYGGDSPYGESLVTLASAADLLVLECSFPEERPEEGHLTPSQAALIAARAGARRLVLTHFYPAAEGSDLITPARKHYDGELHLAFDGMEVTI